MTANHNLATLTPQEPHASENISSAGYVLANQGNIAITLAGFLEHFAPEAAARFNNDSEALAQDFLDMLGEIPA